MKKHKKFALLEDDTIEPLYYSNSEPRHIDEDGCLILDRFCRFAIMTMCLKIVKEGDTKKELKEFKEKNEDESEIRR